MLVRFLKAHLEESAWSCSFTSSRCRTFVFPLIFFQGLERRLRLTSAPRPFLKALLVYVNLPPSTSASATITTSFQLLLPVIHMRESPQVHLLQFTRHSNQHLNEVPIIGKAFVWEKKSPKGSAFTSYQFGRRWRQTNTAVVNIKFNVSTNISGIVFKNMINLQLCFTNVHWRECLVFMNPAHIYTGGYFLFETDF